MTSLPETQPADGSRTATWAGRFALLLLLWWILAEGYTASLPFGALAAALVATVSLRLFPATGYRLHWRAVPGFLLFFLTRSVVAGLDVAACVLRPSLPIAPGELTVPSRLPAGALRWLLADILSLLPGTLSVALRDEELVLHCLDREAAVTESVREVEDRVAALFGVTLEEGS